MMTTRSSVSAYEEIGGHEAMKTAVTVFYNRVLADSELAPWFENVDLSRLRAHQRAFLTIALGGPEVFGGRSLADGHSGLAITSAAFERMIELLAISLIDVGVAQTIVAELTTRLQTMRDQIVTA